MPRRSVLELLPPGPDVEAARAEADALAEQGYRVLAVAEDRSWVGLVGVGGPASPRCPWRGRGAAAAPAIRTYWSPAITPATARAVAAQVGILARGRRGR